MPHLDVIPKKYPMPIYDKPVRVLIRDMISALAPTSEQHFTREEANPLQPRPAGRGRDDGPKKQVRLMFPMVTTVEEMRKIRSFVHKAERQLIERRVPFGKIPIGLMIEVPAAAVAIDALLEEADFVSIGSNDLVQYLMAADRDNPKVNHLCQPLSPPVLRVLSQVISALSRAHCFQSRSVSHESCFLGTLHTTYIIVSPMRPGKAPCSVKRASAMKEKGELWHVIFVLHEGT